VDITFLGTGTSMGIPVIGCNCLVCSSTNDNDKRLRSSVSIRTKDKHLIIDTGPDFRTQILKYVTSVPDAILITHEHFDHVGGLDDIRPLNFISKKPMPIYAGSRTINDLNLRFHYSQDLTKPNLPQFQFHEITYDPFFIDELPIIPLKVFHGELPIWGYRIGDFAYITDASSLPEETMMKLQNIQVLVINALRTKPHPTHFNIQQALDVVNQIQPQKCYLTHLSHQAPSYLELKNTLPKNIEPAYDGLTITIDE